MLCEISCARKCLKVQECRIAYQLRVKAKLGVVDRGIASLPEQCETPLLHMRTHTQLQRVKHFIT